MSSKSPPPICSSQTIERFLADELNAADSAAFELHVETCNKCRRDLESLAADPTWWNVARDSLLPAAGGPSGSAVLVDGQTPRIKTSAEALPRDSEFSASLLSALKGFLNPTDNENMLGRIGHYEIIGIIGSGGNGVVLKGFDPGLSRNVAIKLLSPRMADNGTARRRFSREAQAAAAVVHDNVICIHAVAETNGLPYLVMPYVRGPSLEHRLRTSGPLALEEVLRVGRQVAAGLAAAHAQGLVHRDIKPANILLEEGVERVWITDFGLARAIDDASLTRSGVVAGTPQYMSPEQAKGEPVDHRGDLFSLGCVLYTACAGHSPFRADTPLGVLRKICDSEPRNLRELNPTLPLWLVRMIQRLLAKNPAERYESASVVADLMERALAHVQQPDTHPLPEELQEEGEPKWLNTAAHRYRIAVAVFLLAAGVTIWSLRGTNPDTTPVEHAQVPPTTTAPVVTGASNNPDALHGDQIQESLDQLAVEIDQLSAAVSSGLDSDDSGVGKREPIVEQGDSVAPQIEQLERDVKQLESQVAEPSNQTLSQEK